MEQDPPKQGRTTITLDGDLLSDAPFESKLTRLHRRLRDDDQFNSPRNGKWSGSRCGKSGVRSRHHRCPAADPDGGFGA